jgi:RNA polymerase sigma factor (sigma-70 family)
MATAPADTLLRHLHKLAAGGAQHWTDRQLLDDFAQRRDEAAFAALVSRHGPMVLRVCRRVLGHEQDAEDAFQATFLVLAQHPRSIRRREALASWLHGVAYRIAMKAMRSKARRRHHEARVLPPAPQPAAGRTWGEVQAALDEELQRLSERFRAAFVLHVLEGKSGPEAAAALGCKEGTLKSRVSRARRSLQRQLARRGIQLAALLAAVAVAESSGRASMPAALARATVRLGLLVAAGGPAAGTVPARVAALAAGVTRTMSLAKTKIAVIALFAVGLFAAGAGTLARQAPAAPQEEAKSQAGARPPAAGTTPPAADDSVAVGGRVLGPDGAPFPGAEILVMGKRRATSGPGGRFSFRLPRSEADDTGENWRARPWSVFEIVAAANGYGHDWAPLAELDKGELTLRLLEDDIPVKGRVRDLQGRPVAGAFVGVVYLQATGKVLTQHAWPGLSEGVQTDRDGRYTLTGVGRDRTVHLAITGPTIADQSLAVVTHSAASATVEVVAPPSRPLGGTIRAKDTGKPLAGVSVEARLAVDFTLAYPYSGVTDGQGRFQIRGLPKGARYEVRASPGKGCNYLPCLRQVPDSEGFKPIDVDFELRHGVPIRFRILDKETGKPLHGLVQYDLTRDNPYGKEAVGPLPPELAVSPEWFRGATPDKELYFNMVVYPGSVVVMARAEFGGRAYLKAHLDPSDEAKGHYPAGKGDPVNVFLSAFHAYRRLDARPADKPLTFDLVADPGRTLTGTLLGPGGRPVRGARAYGLGSHYTPEGGSRGGDERLENAAFTVTCVDPKEPCTLSFIHEGRKLIGYVVVREKDGGPLAVRMGPWGVLTGRLVDVHGKPQAGVRVRLVYPALPAPGLRPMDKDFLTDREGRFRVEGLAPGLKHELTLHPDPAAKVALSAGDKLKGLSTGAGEVKDLGDVRVKPAE